MRTSRRLFLLAAAACLTGGPLAAQRLEDARAVLAKSALPLMTPGTRDVRVAPRASHSPRRWPFVVGGAVVGGVLGGVWLAHRAQRTDDAMVFPVYAIGSVGAGAALGALGGLVVSVVVDPTFERRAPQPDDR